MSLASVWTLISSLGVRLKESNSLQTLLTFTFFFATFAWIYFSLTVLSSSDDHFFHFRFAEVMRTEGFFTAFREFHALQFSKMAEGIYFTYYNFLFYLAILPFTYLEPLYLGIKLYAVTAAAGFFTVLYVALRYFRVPYAFVWTVGVFSLASVESLWRLLSSRPFVLAPAFLIVLVLLLHRRHRLGAGLLSFVYLFWYSATFFLPIVVAMAYYVFEYLYTRKADSLNLVLVTLGVLGSVGAVYLLAPGFFTYLNDIAYSNILNLHADVKLPEGAELYPSDIFAYARGSSVLFAALIFSLCFEIYTYLSQRTAAVLTDPYAHVRATLLSLILFFIAAGITITGRFNDYLLLFAGVYVVLAITTLSKNITVTDRALQTALKWGAVITLTYLFIATCVTFNSALAQSGAPAETFEGVGSWLHENVPPGTVIFHPTWNWFPQLYYFNPDLKYIAGLEPRFLYAFDERLYWLWTNASYYGYVCEVELCPDLFARLNQAHAHPDEAAGWRKEQGDALAQVLTHDFQSSYIVSSYEFVALNTILDNNKHFEKVYGGNRTYYIYRIKP